MAKKPKQPAHQCADARTLTEKEDETTGNNLVPVTQNTLNCAQARASARLTIHRDGDMETIVIDNQTFYRDVGIGRLCGLARPRDIRRRFAAMIEQGKLAEHQYILLDDDDGGNIYYVDKETALRAAFRSNTGDAESVVMRMVGAVSKSGEVATRISLKDALSGCDRIISFLAKKDTPRAAKIAKLPLLERFCREAGISMPDVSELLGPETQRLPGV